MGTCCFPMPKVLAGMSAKRHNFRQVAHPSSRCSQGGVKIPTGGKGDVAQARERLLHRELPPGNSQRRRVSRFGVIPKPTVIVRMKENGGERSRVFGACPARSVCPDSGPERGKP